MKNGKFNPSALLKAKAEKRKKREPKTYKLSIRFTAEQIAVIGQAAKSMGHNMASYCRQIILKKKIKGVDEPTMNELRLILNDVRELKEQLNS